MFVLTFVASLPWKHLKPSKPCLVDRQLITPLALYNQEATVPLRWLIALLRAAVSVASTQESGHAYARVSEEHLATSGSECVASVRVRASADVVALVATLLSDVPGWNNPTTYPRATFAAASSVDAERLWKDPCTSQCVRGLMEACSRRDDIGLRAFLASVDYIGAAIQTVLVAKLTARGTPVSDSTSTLATTIASRYPDLGRSAAVVASAHVMSVNAYSVPQLADEGSYRALSKRYSADTLKACNFPPRSTWSDCVERTGDAARAWRNFQPRRLSGRVFTPYEGANGFVSSPKGMECAERTWVGIW